MDQNRTNREDEAIRALNRERLIDYFRQGERPHEACGKLGVEVEHTIVTDDGQPVSYEPAHGRIGVSQVLEELEAHYPKPAYVAGGRLIGLAGEEGSVTLEPAAQLELSAAPYERVCEVETAFRHFYEHVNAALAPSGCRLVTLGYHPTRRALDLTLIPKIRYRFMNDYFAHIGSHGERMMRASASTQVSVDFSDEADAVRKMRVAGALAPILAAIMDNTQVFEGRPNAVPIRRLQLWREVDERRCGTPRGLFEPAFGFAAYADWLLATSPIFVDRPAASDPTGPAMRAAFDVPAADVYADAPMERSDVEHLISMFWPDVRLKRFVEIRPADAAPLPQVLGYTALIKGLFYSEESLAAVEDALGVERGAVPGKPSPDLWPVTPQDVNEGMRQIQARGFAGEVLGTGLGDWERLLFELARAALPADERPYLDPLEGFAHDKPWWNV